MRRTKTKIKLPVAPMGTAARVRSHPMTLLEVLIAVFILIFGIIGVMSLVPVAVRQAADALQATHGAAVAQNARTSLMSGSVDVGAGAAAVFRDDIDWEAGRMFFFPYPDLWDDDNVEWHVDDSYIHEDNGAFFVLADPAEFAAGESASYAWQARMERIDGPYYQVQLTVFLSPQVEPPRPRTFRRDVYSTVFIMTRP